MRRPCRRGAVRAACRMSAPLAGVRLSITRTNLAVTTETDGKFAFESDVPPGKLDLFIDGRNVTNSSGQQYPSLHFEFNAIRGQRNILPHPIYLPPLLMSEAKVVGGNQDVSLKIPGFEGFEMIIKANSVTFPDGAKVGPLVVSPVHLDKLPMVPPSGTATFMAPAWTIQPSGTRFDPPIEVRIPNSINLKPGETREIYQWDHDLATFVPMGRATVNEDASLLVSDAGSGITKAGWGGPPSVPPPDPDCAKTKGPSEDDCGEKCQILKATGNACGALNYCARPDPPSPVLTSEKNSCCDGDKYDKNTQCCVKIPFIGAPYAIAEKDRPFEVQSGKITGYLGALKNGVADFEIPPIQFEGLPESNKNGVEITPVMLPGDTKSGIVIYAVDGCSVPGYLRPLFPPRLFINKADPATLIRAHPDAEEFYQGCAQHDICFQTCGKLQSVCNAELDTALKKSCAKLEPWLAGTGFYDTTKSTGPLMSEVRYVVSALKECNNNREQVILGLDIGGFAAFKKRQREMCLVCK